MYNMLLCTNQEKIGTYTVFAYFSKKKLGKDKPEMTEDGFLWAWAGKGGRWGVAGKLPFTRPLHKRAPTLETCEYFKRTK